jgi:hypothetical protein
VKNVLFPALALALAPLNASATSPEKITVAKLAASCKIAGFSTEQCTTRSTANNFKRPRGKGCC